MSLEKVTKLASVEIVFPERAINAAWHTYITENGAVISGPSIHRKAFPNEDISELMPEIAEFISADYLQVVAENVQLIHEVEVLKAQLAKTTLELVAATSTGSSSDYKTSPSESA